MSSSSFDESSFGGGSKDNGNGKGDDSSAPPPSEKKTSINFGMRELGIFLGIWLLIFVLFKLYSKWRASRLKKTSWFGPNREKEAYLCLLKELEDDEDKSNEDDLLLLEEKLKKALLRRTMTTMRRLFELQEDSDCLSTLSRNGSLSEELMASFKTAQNELQAEMLECQEDAETLKEGWGDKLFDEAGKMIRLENESNSRRKSPAMPTTTTASSPSSPSTMSPSAMATSAPSPAPSSTSSTGGKKENKKKDLSEEQKAKLMKELLEEDGKRK